MEFCVVCYNWPRLFFFLLSPVSLGFARYSNIGIQVVWGSVWLVRTVESMAYLKEYNVLDGKCTAVTVHEFISVNWTFYKNNVTSMIK